MCSLAICMQAICKAICMQTEEPVALKWVFQLMSLQHLNIAVAHGCSDLIQDVSWYVDGIRLYCVELSGSDCKL